MFGLGLYVGAALRLRLVLHHIVWVERNQNNVVVHQQISRDLSGHSKKIPVEFLLSIPFPAALIPTLFGEQVFKSNFPHSGDD